MFTLFLKGVLEMARYQQITLNSFQKQFSTEEACHDQLFSLKWSNGYYYEKCGHDAYFETKTRKHRLYECKKMPLPINCHGKIRTDLTTVLVGLFLNKKGHPLFLKMEFVSNIKSRSLKLVTYCSFECKSVCWWNVPRTCL